MRLNKERRFLIPCLPFIIRNRQKNYKCKLSRMRCTTVINIDSQLSKFMYGAESNQNKDCTSSLGMAAMFISININLNFYVNY